VVIPAFNEEKYIGQCIDSVINNGPDTESFEVIVVDNGSTDRTAEIAASFTGVRVFHLPDVNVGAVRNFGASESRSPFLAFIDADCLLPAGWLEFALKAIKKDPEKAYGGGCKLRNAPCWVEKYWLLEHNGEATLPKDLIGASVVIARETFNSTRGFNEDITSGEDTDLSRKLVSNGFNVQIVPELSVIHLGNARTIPDFFKRQTWHASNYLENTSASLRDPVFILVCTFILLIILSALALLMGHGLFAPLFLTAFFLPLMLSVKRIIRARIPFGYAFRHLLQIYLLDLTYLAGRSFGLPNNLYRKLRKRL